MHWARISKEIQFDAGHRVPNHKSKCRNPHGHRYKVVVHCVGSIIETPGVSDEGMLIDFSDLKVMMETKVHDVLDHGFIVYVKDDVMLESIMGREWNVTVFPYIPTAENIARWIYEQLEPAINNRFTNELILDQVEVWETPTSCAYYSGAAS